MRRTFGFDVFVCPCGGRRRMSSIKPMVEQVETRSGGFIPDKLLADANHATLADIKYLAAPVASRALQS